MKKRSIYGLDLIRFAAAMLVMVYHLGFRAWVYPGYIVHAWLGVPPAVPVWGFYAASGWIGVQIFFVISGFVIANSSDGASPFGFAAGRVRRLVPAAWICATVALVTDLWWGVPAPRALRLWLAVMSFDPFGPWVLGQFWTLPIEIVFYGLMLTLITGDWMRHLPTIGLAMAMLSLGYLAVGGHVSPLLLLQHGCFFALGIAMWQIWKFGLSPIRLATVLVAVGGAVLQIGMARRYEAGTVPTVGTAVPLAIFAGAVAALWLSIQFNDRLHFLDRHAGVVRMLGLSTYPLYLIHVQVGGAVMAIGLRAGVASGIAVLLGCAASLAVALVIAALFEPTGQRWTAALFARAGSLIAKHHGADARMLRPTRRLAL